MDDGGVSGGRHTGRSRAERALEQRVEERTRELSALLEVSRNLSSTLALEPLLDLILDQLLRVIDYRGVSVIVARDDMLETVASRSTRENAAGRSEVGYTVPLARAWAIWQALLRGDPVVIGDVRRADDPFSRTWREAASYDSESPRSSVRSWLGVPLSAQGQVFGFLALTRDVPDSFTAHDIELAVAFAGHAAVAIDNARLLEESEQRARELSSLLGVAASMASTLQLEPLLDVILDQLKVVADYDGCILMTVEGDELRILADRGGFVRDRTNPEVVGRRMPVARAGVLWERLSRREPVIIADVRDATDLAEHFRAAIRALGTAETPVTSHVRAWLAVPLVLGDRVIGLIGLSHDQPGYYTPRHAALARVIATQAAAAIENARLYDQTDQRAREMAALLDVSRTLTSTLELEPLLGRLLDQLHVVTEFSSCGVLAFEGDETCALEYRGPLPRAEILRRRVPLDRSEATWRTLARGEAVLIDDVFGDSQYARDYRAVSDDAFLERVRPFTRAWLAVPLVQKGVVSGALVLTHPTPGFYTARHAALALAVAHQAAAAIENARLLAESEQRAHEMATLVEVSRAVASTLDLSPLLDLILEQLKTVVDYRGATLGTIEGDELLIVASRAITPERSSDRGLRFPLRRFGPIWEAIARGEPAIIADVRGDEPAAVEYRALNASTMDGPTHRDIRSWMAVPLALGDRVIGMLSASQDVPDYFTPHHAELALAFANQVAVAIENARLFGEAQGKAALEERQRLARELHDSVSQALFGIALGAGAARRRLELDPAKVGESLDYVLSLADAALTEMRALIFELRPETLEKEGLVAALTRHAAATRARYEIAVDMVLCEEPDVPLAIKEALYRVAQEAIQNAVKHARATHLTLVLTDGADGLSLEVRDDGVGFDSAGDFPGHLGLISMRERMERLGGTLDVESAPGCGTAIRAVLSVERSAPR